MSAFTAMRPPLALLAALVAAAPSGPHVREYVPAAALVRDEASEAAFKRVAELQQEIRSLSGDDLRDLVDDAREYLSSPNEGGRRIPSKSDVALFMKQARATLDLVPGRKECASAVERFLRGFEPFMTHGRWLEDTDTLSNDELWSPTILRVSGRFTRAMVALTILRVWPNLPRATIDELYAVVAEGADALAPICGHFRKDATAKERAADKRMRKLVHEDKKRERRLRAVLVDARARADRGESYHLEDSAPPG